MTGSTGERPAGNEGVIDRFAVRLTLASLSLTTLLAALGTSIANVGLPTLAQDFGAPFQRVQWVVLAYLAALTILAVFAGWLGDRLGRRPLLLTGIAVFSLASIFCALAPSLAGLIAARAIQGSGAALMLSLAMALVSQSVPAAATGRAMGLLGTASAVGTALGPTLGGMLIAAYGWPMLFAVNVPLGLLAWVLAFRFLPARPAPVTEAGVHTPQQPLTLLLDPRLGAGFAMTILVTSVVMATLVVGPFYLSGALLLDPTRVGLVMAAGPIVAAAVGLPAGYATDRWGVSPAIMVGLLAMIASAFLLAMTPFALGSAGYVGPLVTLTAGYALFQAANNTAILTRLPAAHRGLGSGLLGLSRNLGLILGTSVMGLAFTLGSGSADITTAPPEAVAAGMRVAFLTAAALLACSVGLAASTHRWARHSVAEKHAPGAP